MMAVAMAAICTSCSKDEVVEQTAPPTTSTNTEVTIKLSNDVKTRAFFDDNASAEPWEKSISKATLVVERYGDPSEPPVEKIHRVLTADQIAKGNATVGLVNVNVGDFIVVGVGANCDIPQGTGATSIWSDVISNIDVAEYNGSFEQVSTRSMRPEGFTLVGAAIIEVEENKPLVADVPLERSVAKIAMKASVSDNFNNPNVFAGDLRVNSIQARVTNLYDHSFEHCFSYTQASYKSGDYFQNLFYIGHSYRNEFIVSATYDADGNFNTTADQKAVTYNFSINYDGGGNKELIGNHYYRITLNINSMETTDIDVSISVADWESIEDQIVDIG